MREYGRVSPTFWTGSTGKAIRKGGHEGVVVALYLMTAPLSNMLGLYNQPILYMAHDTGLGLEGARKGLTQCLEAGLCRYDEETEVVWVIEMASWQIAKELKALDNRCLGIQREYNGLSNNPFLVDFFEHYKDAFHLTSCRHEKGATQAPAKPSTSTGTGTGKDKSFSPPSGVEVKTDEVNGFDLAGEVPPKPAKPDVPFVKIVELYHHSLPMLPAVEKLTDKRRGYIRQRWAEDLPTIDAWSRYFADVAKSRFLTGQAPGVNGRPPFMANLEWLCNPSNFAKVAEGNYHR